MYGAVSRLQFRQIVNIIALFLVKRICIFLYPMWCIFCWIRIFQLSWKKGRYFFKYCLFSFLVKLSFWGSGQTDFQCFCFVFHVSCVCCAKLLQSHLTLCNSLDYSPSGSSVPGILQARVLVLYSQFPKALSSFPVWQPPVCVGIHDGPFAKYHHRCKGALRNFNGNVIKYLQNF